MKRFPLNKDFSKIFQNPGEMTVKILFAMLFFGYLGLFLVHSTSPDGTTPGIRIIDVWFDHNWTTDDALQQTFPFHKIEHPEVFKGDLINHMMEGYLTPIHYGLSYGITLITRDPIMTAHWVMLIQFVLTIGLVFGAVLSIAGLIPAFFAATWMLHTRHIIQRLTGGLPRGWAAPVIAGYFFAVSRKSHVGIHLVILLGCLVHPPSTFIVALSYGMSLFIRLLLPATRQETKRPFFALAFLAPVYAIIAVLVVKMPADLGSMASYDVVASMPEFQSPGGRFPFIPFIPALTELHIFGFQSFLSRLYRSGWFLEHAIPWVVIALILFMMGRSLQSPRKSEEGRESRIFPLEYATFLFASLIVYALSREFAFKLYVPNRHLQFPLAIFCVVALSTGLWQACARGKMRLAKGVASLGLIAILVCLGSGTGLYGPANFNKKVSREKGVFAWLNQHTAETALIAGHPTFIDPVPLYAIRRAYATTETAHPFYDKYYDVMRKRIEVSLRAHYAKTLEELFQILSAEHIDYFVFDRSRFYPEALAEAAFFRPFNLLLQELTKGPVDQYAYRELPREVSLESFPPMPFRDKTCAVVDVQALGRWLQTNKT